MEIIYILIPLSLVLVAVIVGFVIWAVRSGQFEDLERPAYRILDDDDTMEANRSSMTGGRRDGKSRHNRSVGP
ncbi:MAG: cbb3-type cytochrome oxidase assembly protein CcoS [Gammaproteobacteria bacterium]|nr:cbb3-type cytochrome oxidase assembly protein CcoS [Gammaproteobacteria bacterium]